MRLKQFSEYKVAFSYLCNKINKSMDKVKMLGAMAGAIAASVYPIPDEIAERCNSILTEDLREIKGRFLELVDG